MQKSNFLELVAKERTRQIVEKGYTAKHDDEHTDGSIADAGACYAATTTHLLKSWGGQDGLRSLVEPLWPWHPKFYTRKDHDRKQQLIIAAAFINAEYDRIVRAEQKNSEGGVLNVKD